MGATIKDVAKRAGVSLSTVSFVLNKKKNISSQTTKKVEKAIEELNYHPRHSARGLASKKSGNIGFILTSDHFSHAEPFYTKIFLGTELEARKHNYYILLTTVERRYSKKSIPRFLLEKNVDGVILAGHIPDGLIKFIHDNYNIPIVFIDFLPRNGKAFAVLMDNVDGAEKAVNHLIGNGHRDIAFVSGEMSHPSMQERFIGYKQALKQANIEVNENLVVTEEPDTSDVDGYNACSKLFSRNSKITAIFAANDAMASGCYRCLKEKNLQVPNDVAVVGFDDVELASQMEPHLTTLRVNKEDMGALAARNIVEMISTDKNNYGRILAPVELIVREST